MTRRRRSAIRLGDKVRDRVSGWEGIAVARYQYLNGCVRYSVAGADKESKPDEYVFDTQQLEVVVEGFLDGGLDPAFPPPPDTIPTGGDRSNRPVPR